jgi:SAM-dependent methyltransferase
MQTTELQINEDALNDLLSKAVMDCGAAWHAPLVILGARLGLYDALAEAGPLTSAELAAKTSTAERYVREWLRASAASGYVTYGLDDRYFLTPEQRFCFATEGSPAALIPAFESAVFGSRSMDALEPRFRTGEGYGWHMHHTHFFTAVEKFFRSGYEAHLTSQWLPALDGVMTKLERGARVADIGCGHGASTILMAQRFPNSDFVGYDSHGPSISTAMKRAADAGVSNNVRFTVASAADFDGAPYDFATTFDALHDMGDPIGAAARVRECLKADGTWMIVEPRANDEVQDNLNPVGRLYYSVSTLVCTPCSLAQEVGLALGAQAGEQALREVVTSAGFSRFRRVAETPFNFVFEARI